MPKLPFRLAAVCAAAFAILVAMPACAAFSDFTGRWTNHDNQTRDIAVVRMQGVGDQINVHVWGACQPELCDWGEVPGQVFVPVAGTQPWHGVNAVLAQFTSGATQTLLYLQLVQMRDGTNIIIYRSFVVFTDGSNRHNYDSSGRLDRQ